MTAMLNEMPSSRNATPTPAVLTMTPPMMPPPTRPTACIDSLVRTAVCSAPAETSCGTMLMLFEAKSAEPMTNTM